MGQFGCFQKGSVSAMAAGWGVRCTAMSLSRLQTDGAYLIGSWDFADPPERKRNKGENDQVSMSPSGTELSGTGLGG
jgi:hypothetical protein